MQCLILAYAGENIMSLVSNLFLLFVAAGVIVYYLVPAKWQWLVLLAFSYIYYIAGGIRYVGFLLFSTFVTWLTALAIEKMETAGKHKTARKFVILGLVLNFGMLGLAKYTNFAIENLNALFHMNLRGMQILLPLGISFYTFQLLSYVVDVYRGEVEAQTHFFRLLLYTSLFHQCIAGPIVLYKDISEEILYRQINRGEVARGINRFAAGLAKKAVLANTCGLLADQFILTDAAVADVSQFTQNAAALSAKPAVILWMGVLFFMLQIYLDFSAYSDMAIGMGLMIGFHYKENFNYPYLSSTVSEFWRRWHISLGSFFRD